MPRTYHDDNFGCWDDMDDPDTVAFYHKVQRSNVRKKCQGCGRSVMLQPHYAICDSCATRAENGMDY